MFLGNLTEEQRLSKAVVKIMDKAPYLSAVLMIGRREITDNRKREPHIQMAKTSSTAVHLWLI